jgi:hypothetical protein
VNWYKPKPSNPDKPGVKVKKDANFSKLKELIDNLIIKKEKK